MFASVNDLVALTIQRPTMTNDTRPTYPTVVELVVRTYTYCTSCLQYTVPGSGMNEKDSFGSF